MKAYKLIALCVASLFIGACDNSLDKDVSLHVSVASNENISYDGQIITVKKGTPIEFLLSGDPDFLTFFSGEIGKKYLYRQRETIDPSQIKSSTLNFSLWFRYGSFDMIEKHIYISEDFTGLYKNNFEADSLLVEQVEKDGGWKELVKAEDFPTKLVSDAADATPYSFDMTEYMGKRITLAICYRGVDNTKTQPRMNFEQMRISNVLNNGQTTEYMAGSFGFTPINMKYKWNLADQSSMTKDREYGTVTNNTAGIWNLANIGNGGFFIHSSNENNPLKYSWLVSDMITINSCTPDQGTQIKNVSQRLDSYTYTYDQIGIYNATFLANNMNMEHSSTTKCELVINVVE